MVMFNRNVDAEPEFENERQRVKKLVDAHMRGKLNKTKKFRDGTIRPVQLGKSTDLVTVMDWTQRQAYREIYESAVLLDFLTAHNADMNMVKNFTSAVVKKALAWKRGELELGEEEIRNLQNGLFAENGNKRFRKEQ